LLRGVRHLRFSLAIFIPECRANRFSPSCFGAHDKSWEAALEGRGAGRMFAADTNGATAAAGYGILSARIGATQRSAQWTFAEFLRVDNLFDRPYVGSVIVNQANLQFYEPAPAAPGRSAPGRRCSSEAAIRIPSAVGCQAGVAPHKMRGRRV